MRRRIPGAGRRAVGRATRRSRIFHQRPEGRALLAHVDENLAEATIGIISCSEVDLLTADARLLGVAVAPVGEAFALRKPGDRGGGRPLPVPSLIFVESGSWGSKDAPFLSFSAAQSSMAISWS